MTQRLQKEMQESKNTANKELQEMKQQLKELSDQLADTQAGANKAEETNMSLK